MSSYNVIGAMSGTSLDGLDVCYCTFKQTEKWSFAINKATTVDIPLTLREKLKIATTISGLDLALLNNEVGDYIGNTINSFIHENGINKDNVDFISSHGHTIFHQPEKNLTLQIGNGANISTITELPVVCDFRTTDLALGGNGAPLVPIGDKLLFNQYDYCINLGGIANISYQDENNRVAFDICPVNIVLNHLANKLDLEYDKNGELAKSGIIDSELLKKLNDLDYYHTKPPKSLGYEWILENIFPLLKGKTNDLLYTFTEHIAQQISKHLDDNKNVLFTGGGTYNTYLIERIKDNSNCNLIIPTNEIIDFKEALIFGFLGVLRYKNKKNTLKTVTGAKKDNVGGCIYNPLGI